MQSWKYSVLFYAFLFFVLICFVVVLFVLAITKTLFLFSYKSVRSVSVLRLLLPQTLSWCSARYRVFDSNYQKFTGSAVGTASQMSGCHLRHLNALLVSLHSMHLYRASVRTMTGRRFHLRLPLLKTRLMIGGVKENSASDTTILLVEWSLCSP